MAFSFHNCNKYTRKNNINAYSDGNTHVYDSVIMYNIVYLYNIHNDNELKTY